VAFIFFRSPSANAAVYMISRLVYPHDLGNFHNLSVMRIEGLSLRIFGLPLIFGMFAAFFGKSSEQRAREFQPTYANSLLVASTTLASWVFMNSNIAAPFVYFKF
jgi:predicted membrane protein